MGRLAEAACRAGAMAMAMTVVGAGAPAACAATSRSPRAVVVCGAGGLKVNAGLMGGYDCTSTRSQEVMAAARTLIAYVDRNYPTGASRGSFSIRSAAEQVVTGVNYQLVIHVSGQAPETVVGTVHRPLTGPESVISAYVLAG